MTKTPVCRWRVGEGGKKKKKRETRSEKVPHEATSRRNAICVLFLFCFFKVAKIIQKLNQYVRGAGKKKKKKKNTCFLLSVIICFFFFFACDDSVSTCFLFINSVLVLLQTLRSNTR